VTANLLFKQGVFFCIFISARFFYIFGYILIIDFIFVFEIVLANFLSGSRLDLRDSFLDSKPISTGQMKISSETDEIDGPSKAKVAVKWVLKYLASTVIGFIFGYSMEKAKVYEPIAIRQQMIFRKFIMLKMFLASLCTSVLAILFFALIFRNRYARLLQSAKTALSPKSPVSIVTGLKPITAFHAANIV
jgi:hypothetical protein